VDRDDLTGRLGRGRAALTALADLLLPRACVVCGALLRAEEDDLVCGGCWLRATELPRPRCARCGHSSRLVEAGAHGTDRRTSRPCQWCDTLPPYVRSARSAYALPGGTAESIVHALKYAGWRDAARGMARRMASLRFPDDVEQERAGLVPVPLSSSRQRERGYNQSAELARWLAARWGLPVMDSLLERTRATRTQTRLTPGERHRNVSGAFRARAARSALRGLHLVLVDDVVTTGATLNACAAALHDGGARILSFVTFGRAPAVGDRW
jgi:ComF family protein